MIPQVDVPSCCSTLTHTHVVGLIKLILNGFRSRLVLYSLFHSFDWSHWGKCIINCRRKWGRENSIFDFETEWIFLRNTFSFLAFLEPFPMNAKIKLNVKNSLTERNGNFCFLVQRSLSRDDVNKCGGGALTLLIEPHTAGKFSDVVEKYNKNCVVFF